MAQADTSQELIKANPTKIDMNKISNTNNKILKSSGVFSGEICKFREIFSGFWGPSGHLVIQQDLSSRLGSNINVCVLSRMYN